jgi:choline dehydrogenase-like flavoprotein
MPLTETKGVYCAHPLGGCRMADSPDLGVVDDAGAVYGYEGLYCVDGSIVPTSLGVNPSLTISALSERAAERLVNRAGELGLPATPAHLRAQAPPEHIGARIVPHQPPPPPERRRHRERPRRRKRPHHHQR